MKLARDFSVISMRSKAELCALAQTVFWEQGSAKNLGLDQNRLGAFVRAVARRYRTNSYHNFQHAVDTVHRMAWFLALPSFRNNLRDRHKFLLLVAALVHDVEHPGHDNLWELRIRSPWAEKYRSNSVLECHSLAVSRRLMENEERNVFSVFEPGDREEMDRLFERVILVTDFACHADFVAKFSRWLARHQGDYSNRDFVPIICCALIKAADIGNAAKPFPVAKRWGLRVLKECWAQGKEEKSHNFPVGPLNDPDVADFNVAQAGFIKNSALGLFQLLERMEPELGPMVRELEANMVCYEENAKRSLPLVK